MPWAVMPVNGRVLQTTSPALRQGLLDTCEDGVTAERL